MNKLSFITILALAFLNGCSKTDNDNERIRVKEINNNVFLTDQETKKVFILKEGVFQEIKRDGEYWRPRNSITKDWKIDDFITLSMEIEYIGTKAYYSMTFTASALPKFEVTNNLGEKNYVVDHDNYNNMVRRVRNGSIDLRFENSRGLILQRKTVDLNNITERSVGPDSTPQIILSGSFDSLLLPEPPDQPLNLTLSHNI